jgi:hypothetical protein
VVVELFSPGLFPLWKFGQNARSAIGQIMRDDCQIAESDEARDRR